jgi:hypothetical protein
MPSENQSPNPSPNTAPQESPTTTKPSKKRVRWIRVLIALNFVVVLPAIVILIAIFNHSEQSPTDYSGLAFLFLFLPVFIAALVVLILDLISLAAYLIGVILHKESGGPTKKTAAVIAFLLLLYLVGAPLLNNFLQPKHAKPLTDAQVLSLISSCSISSLTKTGDEVTLNFSNNFNPDDSKYATPDSAVVKAAGWSKFIAEVKIARPHCIGLIAVNDSQTPLKYSWVSTQQATNLLQQCAVDTFGYSLPDSLVTPSSGTPTGIILESNLPFSDLYIKPSQEATMIPVAKTARSKCGAPVFYHEGRYEVRQTDGSWK